MAGGSIDVSFTLAASAALACPVTVGYRTTPGTATGGDYHAVLGSITFPAGSVTGTSRTVSIPIVADTLDEDDETFAVDLADPVGAGLGSTTRTTVTILDDDGSPSVSVANVTVAEPDTGTVSALVVATLSAPSGRPVPVDYATTDGTATAGQDYLAASGTLTIPAGSATAAVAIPIVGDHVPESPETVTLTIANAVHASIATAAATVTITDGDALTIGLSANQALPVAAGTAVTWTATVSGGDAPYQYQFWVNDTAVGWREMQAYGTGTTFAWAPALAGSDQVQVRVLDAGSPAAWDGLATTATFTVTAPSAIATSVSLTHASPVNAGTALAWTATASGGAGPLQYQFILHAPDGDWIVLRDYGASTGVPWIPTTSGVYSVQVWVRSAGSTAEYDAFASSGSVVVAAVAPVVVSLTPDRVLPVAPGTPITWTAVGAAGATPLEYKFVLLDLTTGLWTVEQDYGAAPAWTWTPTQTGPYALQVWMRQQGSGASYDAWLGSGTVNIATGTVPSVSLTATQTFPTATGAPVTWTAGSSGGTAPLLYRFILYDATTATWTIVRDWSADRGWSWTPVRGAFGLHTLQVWVKSADSSADWDAWVGSGWFVIKP